MQKRPHLILITTDQQRGDCLGLAGHPVLSTPNMDEIGGTGGRQTLRVPSGRQARPRSPSPASRSLGWGDSSAVGPVPV